MGFVLIFSFEILSRFIAKKWKLYVKDIANIFDIIGIWFCLANFAIKNNTEFSF